MSRIYDLMENAYKQMEIDNMEKSLEYFEQVLEINQNYEDAILGKGLMLIRLKRWKEGMDTFQLVPESSAAQFRMGQANNLVGMYNNAYDNFKKCLELGGDFAEAWFEFGICARKMDFWEEGIEAFEKCLTVLTEFEKDSEVQILENLALCYKGKDKNIQAGNCYELLANKTSEKKWWEERVRCLLNIDIEESEKILTIMLQMDENWHMALSMIGDIWFKKKEYEKASIFYERAIKVQWEYQLFFNCGLCYKELCRYEEAIERLESAKVCNCLKDEPIHEIARILIDIGIYESTLSILDEHLEHWSYKNSKLLLIDKSDCLSFLNRHTEEVKVYDQLLELDPENTEVMEWKANVLRLSLNDIQNALIMYERGISLDSTNFVFWYGAGNCMFKLGKYEESILKLERAIELIPHVWSFWYKGRCYYELGLYKIALIDLNKAVEFEENSATYTEKAKCLEKLGRRDEATVCLEKAIELQNQDDHYISVEELQKMMKNLTI